MSQEQIFLFVEGTDDSRLITHLYETLFDYNIFTYEYAQQTLKKVNNFIRSVEAMQASYVFFADLDNASSPEAKIEQLIAQYPRLKSEQCQIVVIEIESWYMAGVTDEQAEQLKIRKLPKQTNQLTKEQFNALMPNRFTSRIDFMREIVRHFSVEQAQIKNQSFQTWLMRG